MRIKENKDLIYIIISVIAIVISIFAIIKSSYFLNSNLKITEIFISIFASIIGAFLFILYKKLSTRKYKSKIFISYSYKDEYTANKIKNTLISERFILNIDPKNIQVGENINDVISNEMKSSSVVIVLLSKESIKSQFVKEELNQAIADGKKILPILLEYDAEIPEQLKNIQYADYAANKTEAIHQIIKALKNILKEEKISA